MIAKGVVLGGKYVVERVLGEGGMGVVVAAKHAQLGHRVAIKMMLGDALRDPGALARFEREARAAADLASEHVARVTDVGHFDDGMPYMVMEYLEGEDLAARIKRSGPLPVGDAVRMFIQACIGLGDAHERGIVHRDVKPSNLFLSARRGGRVTLKVLDFGIAKASIASAEHQLTRTSSTMGSPQYMSPEQLRDTKNVDARTDLWSLGATIYEALTGVPAFPAETLAELHVKILIEQPLPTFHHRPEVPLELDAIVMRCLAKKPDERFRSMQELQDVLEQAERALAVPRVAFQSNPALVETFVPHTREDIAFAATGESRAGAGESVRSAPNSSQPELPDAPLRAAPMEAEGRSARAFSPTFVATDNPIAQTVGAASVPRARRVRSTRALGLGVATLVVVAVVALKLVSGRANSAATLPGPAQPVSIDPVADAPTTGSRVASPPTALEADADGTARSDVRGVGQADASATVQATKGPATSKASAVAGTPRRPQAPPKPRKKSALDVDLD